jgi:plasmid maintenance system killer protein
VLLLASIQRTGSLQLAFESKQLRTICEDEVQAKAELGETVAKTLKHRLADLRAATSIKDLLAGSPRLLPQSQARNMVVDLCEGWCLVLVANHVSNPTMLENNLDWSRVTRIKILRIEEGHG